MRRPTLKEIGNRLILPSGIKQGIQQIILRQDHRNDIPIALTGYMKYNLFGQNYGISHFALL